MSGRLWVTLDGTEHGPFPLSGITYPAVRRRMGVEGQTISDLTVCWRKFFFTVPGTKTGEVSVGGVAMRWEDSDG